MGSDHQLDTKAITQQVIENIGPNVSERNRKVFTSLIQHLHDFARDVDLTVDEWMAGMRFVNSLGQIFTPQRNETHRICDVLGLESIVDFLAHQQVSESGLDPTSSSILGPFWSPNAPFRELGASIVQDPTPNARPALMHGVVKDTKGNPIENAVVDIWQASSNGKYDFQDPENQSDNNLRGKFRTNKEGKYWFYALHPTPYSLPTDGPAGVLLRLLERHPMRPAHLHLMVTHPNYQGVTTQLFPSDDPYVATDTVFAVKPDLVVNFKPLKGDSKAELELDYNFVLADK